MDRAALEVIFQQRHSRPEDRVRQMAVLVRSDLLRQPQIVVAAEQVAEMEASPQMPREPQVLQESSFLNGR